MPMREIMPTPTSLKILYVEDDPDIRVIARIALEDIGGFDIRSCGCGPEALEAIAHYRPDFLLLDVTLPDMDGPTLLGHLRRTSNGAAAPVIFMTARVQKSEVARYLALGAIDVIAKPFDPLTLPAKITQWVVKG